MDFKRALVAPLCLASFFAIAPQTIQSAPAGMNSEPTPVPEPAILCVLGIGLAGLAARLRRRQVVDTTTARHSRRVARTRGPTYGQAFVCPGPTAAHAFVLAEIERGLKSVDHANRAIRPETRQQERAIALAALDAVTGAIALLSLTPEETQDIFAKAERLAVAIGQIVR